MRTIRSATTLLLLAACGSKVIDVGSNHPPDTNADAGLDAGTGGNFAGNDPCAPVRSQALSILQGSFAACHTGSDPLSGVHGFDILDVDRLMRTTAMSPYFAAQGWRYIVPGDPDRSLIDVRIEDGTMPKQVLDDPAMLQFTVPTSSQRSVLRDWITSCLGPDPLQPDVGRSGSIDASLADGSPPTDAIPPVGTGLTD
jgi:hypothetical protein